MRINCLEKPRESYSERPAWICESHRVIGCRGDFCGLLQMGFTSLLQAAVIFQFSDFVLIFLIRLQALPIEYSWLREDVSFFDVSSGAFSAWLQVRTTTAPGSPATQAPTAPSPEIPSNLPLSTSLLPRLGAGSDGSANALFTPNGASVTSYWTVRVVRMRNNFIQL